MTEPPRELSLQGLDRLLAQLPVGGQIAIGQADRDRIFGINDVVVRRLAHFGRGHGCDTVVTAGTVIFTKRHRGPG